MTPASLYECSVMHCRLKPLRHAFCYRVFMLDVDLDALPEIAAATRGLGHNRFNLFSIDARDHIDLGLPGGLRANLAAWLAQQGFTLPADASVRLLTFPRVLGYGFNPVSFFYLFDAAGAPVGVVAEVVNTFREMKLYLLDKRGSNNSWQLTTPKNFYVSPFSDPGDTFDFRLGQPGTAWQVHIDNLNGGETFLVSSVHGQQRELTSARLCWYALKYPLLSLKIIGLIHWHALRLWLRRVPFFRKADRLDVQRDVLRPHSSISKSDP
jgi:DUF1365 family protein